MKKQTLVRLVDNVTQILYKYDPVKKENQGCVDYSAQALDIIQGIYNSNQKLVESIVRDIFLTQHTYHIELSSDQLRDISKDISDTWREEYNGLSISENIRCTDEKDRFINFVEELEKLSFKYGIIIRSVGGVVIFEEGQLEKISYSKDSTSGDLEPYFKRL